MYIEKLGLRNIRTFREDSLTFIHPDTTFCDRNVVSAQNDQRLPKPILPNVNLLLGENGAGKTTVLQAIGLASLGPAAPIAQLPLPKFVRWAECEESQQYSGRIAALFEMHIQDTGDEIGRNVQLDLERRSEVEYLRLIHDIPKNLSASELEARVTRQKIFSNKSEYHPWIGSLVKIANESKALQLDDDSTAALSHAVASLVELFNVSGFPDAWQQVNNSNNPSFFCVAYGATRRIDPGDNRADSRPSSPFPRAQRVQSIFQESFSLYPLRYWLPALKSKNLQRHTEILSILNSLISDENCRLTDKERDGDLLFERHGLKLPLSELSDGYRAFIAWVADLLYHLSYACPGKQSLLDCRGIVLVDEIDLHLHPRWQMKVVSTIANAFPKMQFIFTSHSPLIVGSVEWMNILTLQTDPATNETDIKRWPESVHGLDADQILLTKFFGLTTTRAGAKVSELEALREAALAGDRKAARALLRAMSTGTEYQP